MEKNFYPFLFVVVMGILCGCSSSGNTDCRCGPRSISQASAPIPSPSPASTETPVPASTETPAPPPIPVPTPTPTPVAPFERNLGGSLNDYANDLVEMPDGSFAIAGYTYSGESGDVSGANKGNTDVWLLKTDAEGNLQWEKNFGGAGYDFAECLERTSDGGFAMVGYTDSSQSGDMSGVNKGGYDTWLLKTDGEGNLQWEKNFGGAGNEFARCVAVTSDGGFAVVSYSDSSQSGDVSAANKGSSDIWLLKTDAEGNLQWEKNFGGAGNDSAECLTVLSDGGYAAAGSTASSESGDVSGVSRGGADIWLLKTDGEGNLQWEKNFGGAETEASFRLSETSDGGIAVAGRTASSESGDVSGVSRGGSDVWLLKTDGEGNLQWEKNFGGDAGDSAYGLAASSDGGYALTGITNSSVSGDVKGATNGKADVWLLKTDGEGNLE